VNTLAGPWARPARAGQGDAGGDQPQQAAETADGQGGVERWGEQREGGQDADGGDGQPGPGEGPGQVAQDEGRHGQAGEQEGERYDEARAAGGEAEVGQDARGCGVGGGASTPPSRLVLLLDELEERHLTERRRNPSDRRHHALYLTDDGTRLMARLGQIGAAHEDDICAPLDAAERAQLHGLLTRIAGHHGLTAGVHPGYRGETQG
jgi:hypothetical protein